MIYPSEQIRTFVGARARLWHFMASHDTLVVKLTAENSSEQFLVLSGCEAITAPVFWHVRDPRVVAAAGFIEFLDEGVRIVCQDVSVHRTYVGSP
jgi:hypothetical protein